MSEATTTEQPEVTKTATCPSLSGSSTLTYEVGTTEQDTYYRVSGNSSAGLFSKDWIPLSQVTDLLRNGSITSRALRVLYEGKSSNSDAFLLAVLKAEGIVRSMEGTAHQYIAVQESGKKKKAVAAEGT
jgi:hypothetical protein